MVIKLIQITYNNVNSVQTSHAKDDDSKARGIKSTDTLMAWKNIASTKYEVVFHKQGNLCSRP